MFTKITLKNFRCFDEIEFDLTRKNNEPKKLAIVYGQNGVGKSNLMSAFVFLRELLKTLDVRDIYEEFLSKKDMFSDEDVYKSLQQSIMSGLRDMSAIIKDCHMIGCSEPICAEYEFSINGSIGKYSVQLNDREIIYERLEFLLKKRRGVYFECSPTDILINSNIIADKDLLVDIKSSAKRFWGKHSLLAIILHEAHDKSESFVWNNLSENFISVLTEFSSLFCTLKIDTRRYYSQNVPFGILEDFESGQIVLEDEPQLDLLEETISQFLSATNLDIHAVYYERNYSEDSIDYQLYVERMIAGQYRQIPFFKESTGNHQLINVLRYILYACIGGIVILDEADAGIHDLMFKNLITEIEPLIEGQVILTTHNTLLMETDFARDAIYIVDQDESGHKSVRCINNYKERTYQNNNIRNKYFNDTYGGLPSTEHGPITLALSHFKSSFGSLIAQPESDSL